MFRSSKDQRIPPRNIQVANCADQYCLSRYPFDPEQSRQAQYDRLTACRGGPDLGKMSGAVLIANADDGAIKLAH
jgi:hypothetical protein